MWTLAQPVVWYLTSIGGWIVARLFFIPVERRSVHSGTILTSTWRAKDCKQWRSLWSVELRSVNSGTSRPSTCRAGSVNSDTVCGLSSWGVGIVAKICHLPVERSSVNSDTDCHMSSGGMWILAQSFLQTVIRTGVHSDTTVSSSCHAEECEQWHSTAFCLSSRGVWTVA